MKRLYHILLPLAVAASLTCCGGSGTASSGMSGEEKALIVSSDEVMYVLDVSDPLDEQILRAQSADFDLKDLSSEEFRILSRKMLATVQSPQQGGVGIAGPQVGLNRRVVVVCRTDKEDEPYEVYPNIRIAEFMGEQVSGPEGCLSVAPLRGEVKRYQKIRIEYIDPETLLPKEEVIEGYAAVIFQHECDHLDGILYTDRADTVYTNDSWKLEREEFGREGLYDKSLSVANLEKSRLKDR